MSEEAEFESDEECYMKDFKEKGMSDEEARLATKWYCGSRKVQEQYTEYMLINGRSLRGRSIYNTDPDYRTLERYNKDGTKDMILVKSRFIVAQIDRLYQQD